MHCILSCIISDSTQTQTDSITYPDICTNISYVGVYTSIRVIPANLYCCLNWFADCRRRNSGEIGIAILLRRRKTVSFADLEAYEKSSIELTTSMEEPNNFDPGSESKPETIYRCKKCRRIVASQEHIVTHEPGEGQKCFKWRKRSSDLNESDKEAHECSSIFVKRLKWMESVQEGCVGDKLQCIGCKARLGNFNWAGMQCNCRAWVNPAFQLHKSKMDECKL